MTQPPVDPSQNPSPDDDPNRAGSGDWLSKPPPVPPGEPPQYPNPYEPAPQPPYGQPTYGQQPPYGQQAPYGQPGYGEPVYGHGGTPLAQLPDHPRSTTALVLGLVGLIGTFTCVLPVLLGPFAWWIGAKARREIDANPAQYGGRGQATAGMILGILTTVVLFVLVALLVLLVGLAATGNLEDSGTSSY